MPNKTEDIRILVQDILRSFSAPYGEDIIEDVFVAIAANPDFCRRYDQLSSEFTAGVLNPWIGKYTKEITGFRSLRQAAPKRTDLIESYTKLAA